MLYEIYKSKQLKFRPILASKLLFLKANIRKTMKIKSILTFKVVRCHFVFPFPFTSRVAYFSLFIECLFSSAVVV